MFKFSMMRVRSKISYHAFKKRKTISEFMLRAILNEYNCLIRHGSIPQIAPYSKNLLKKFDLFLNDSTSSSITDLKWMAKDPALILRRGNLKMQ